MKIDIDYELERTKQDSLVYSGTSTSALLAIYSQLPVDTQLFSLSTAFLITGIASIWICFQQTWVKLEKVRKAVSDSDVSEEPATQMSK
ncbi:MAG: hypothetical protein NPIRA05_22340 [Nitrospirales bacterium]|nr:MAG: hypothetical protein NPIRA05_22340 [Nitrospirales bacterium]